MSDGLTIPVLLGSVRPERQALRAGRMVAEALQAAGHEAVIVDPLALRLPLLERTYSEFETGSAPAGLDELAALYRRADGFIIVSGEYNHGIPPALKNLLDYFLDEYFWRPSGIVCYSSGQFGGVRAAMQLRMTSASWACPASPACCRSRASATHWTRQAARSRTGSRPRSRISSPSSSGTPAH